MTYYGETYTTAATNSVWTSWSDSTEGCGTASFNTQTWKVWSATTSGSTCSATTGTAWYRWVDYDVVVPVRELTEEEKQANERERLRMEQVAREAEERRKEEEKRRQAAEEKALQLLLENLTENQAEVYKATGAIPVQCASGRKYHIRKGIAQNVHELDEKGATARRLCFHPSDCPVYDVMLAQKLMLETAEEEARRIANFS
jgi:hypothetical protein